MASSKINTHSGATFRERYIQPGARLDALLKEAFQRFFVVRVEEMIRMMKLPVPPTRHLNHTFMFLTEGEAIMSIGSETHRIVKGECLVVPAGQVFSFTNVDLNRGYLCNFSDVFLVGRFGKRELVRAFEFLQVWGNPRITLDAPTAQHVRQLFERLLALYAESGVQQPELIQSYVHTVLWEVNRFYRAAAGPEPTQATDLANRFKALLFAQIRTEHRVTAYAEQLHVTPNHLHKAIRKVTGKSPSRWIEETLVLEAKVLLYQTDLFIQEVAAEIGMQDPSYFSRFFKKHAGYTPLAFRKRIESS
ncbi:AraC-type DNA-binding protein [Catalinimonas alkaloidigena]|uniref:AraC-type DNA-binding protein n=1 Tax=Catalinimonas alkaloidigena TaxID=1075417 RepID=A0A1G9LTG7_9BACT|nr:AraC family transcriptional regulator [Catalinimonas alkaloidigena]SDL65203.1 AraC-type DNA-binding protein [Catalinimonas alkaloidigena]